MEGLPSAVARFRDRGLLGLTLRYPYEVRNEAEYFEDIPELKLSKEMLDLASEVAQWAAEVRCRG